MASIHDLFNELHQRVSSCFYHGDIAGFRSVSTNRYDHVQRLAFHTFTLYLCLHMSIAVVRIFHNVIRKSESGSDCRMRNLSSQIGDLCALCSSMIGPRGNTSWASVAHEKEVWIGIDHFVHFFSHSHILLSSPSPSLISSKSCNQVMTPRFESAGFGLLEDINTTILFSTIPLLIALFYLLFRVSNDKFSWSTLS